MNIADNSEFRTVLADLLKSEGVEAHTIQKVLDAYPEAVAIWMRYGGDNANATDHYFGQNKEVVARLHKVPERVHHGEVSADGVVEKEHYALHIKASSNLLRHLSDKFGMEVKNS